VAKRQRPFNLEVFTAEGCACKTDALCVVFPASDGQVGVLGGRAAMAAVIGSGELRIRTQQEELSYFVYGGFAQVRENLMTILTEECTSPAELDREVVWEEIQQAKKLPIDTDEAVEFREKALSAARSKFKLAQRQHKTTLFYEE